MRAIFAIAALTVCDQAAASVRMAPRAKLTAAAALKIAMSPLVIWDKQNAKALDTMYMSSAVGFDASTAPLLVGGDAFVAINQLFKAMNYNKVEVPVKKVQVIDSDVFVFTSVTNLASTKGPGKPVTYRCTDIFQRQSNGQFKIVNEHCSFPPSS